MKDELTELGEKFKERRRTAMASGEDTPEFNEEAYIVRENTNVVLTRDGWVKRVGRLASVEGTRVREGDEVIAVVPGSTLEHVIFLADDGTAYTMRMNEVPATAGYGEPIAKFFKMADQVKVIAAVSTDPRFTPPEQVPANGTPPPPYLLVVTAQGQSAANTVGAVPCRIDQGGPPLRPIERRRPCGDGEGAAQRRDDLPGVAGRARHPVRH